MSRSPEIGNIAIKLVGASSVLSGSTLITGVEGVVITGDKVSQYPLLLTFSRMLKTYQGVGYSDSVSAIALAPLGAIAVLMGLYIMTDSKRPNYKNRRS